MGRKQEEKDVEISRAIALNEVNAFPLIKKSSDSQSRTNFKYRICSLVNPGVAGRRRIERKCQ